MEKIVIVSNAADEHTDMLVQACRRHGKEVFRYNTDHFRLRGKLSWHFSKGNNCKLGIDKHYLELQKANLIVYRRPLFTYSRRKDVEKWIGHLLDREWELVEKALSLEEGNKTIVNPVFSSQLASNKLAQLKAANSIGLDVPETLVSTEKEDLLLFASQWPCVTKSIGSCTTISQGRMHIGKTNNVDQSLLSDFNSQGIPTLLQRKISPNAMWRIIKVGDDCFGFRLYGKELEREIDSRFVEADLKGDFTDVPSSIEAKYLEMCKKFGIIYASSDFIEDKNGKLWFIDLNPEGQWGVYEERFNVPISDAIVSL